MAMGGGLLTDRPPVRLALKIASLVGPTTRESAASREVAPEERLVMATESK